MVLLVCPSDLNQRLKVGLSIVKQSQLVTHIQIQLVQLRHEVIYHRNGLHQLSECIPEALLQLLVIACGGSQVLEAVDDRVGALDDVEHVGEDLLGRDALGQVEHGDPEVVFLGVGVGHEEPVQGFDAVDCFGGGDGRDEVGGLVADCYEAYDGVGVLDREAHLRCFEQGYEGFDITVEAFVDNQLTVLRYFFHLFKI